MSADCVATTGFAALGLGRAFDRVASAHAITAVVESGARVLIVAGVAVRRGVSQAGPRLAAADVAAARQPRAVDGRTVAGAVEAAAIEGGTQIAVVADEGLADRPVERVDGAVTRFAHRAGAKRALGDAGAIGVLL